MKNYFLILLLVLAYDSTVAQSPNWLWAKSAAGTGNEDLYSCTTDSLGNIYATGYFTSPSITFGVTTLSNSNAPGTDILIVKFDPQGNVLWAKSAGGIDMDYGVKITLDANGNVYVIGYYFSPSITFGTYTLNSSSPFDSDVFVVKYDSSGNLLWAKGIGGQGGAYGMGITTDYYGNVYITGEFGINIDFGAITLTSSGNNDMFIGKYDTAGNLLWAKKGGGIYADAGYDIIADVLGNTYVTGKYKSPTATFDMDTLTNNGLFSDDIFIVKYNTVGNVIWASGAGGSGQEYCRIISADTLGNLYLAGAFTSDSIFFGGNVLTNAGNNDIVMLKYDTSGNELWAAVAGSSGDDYGRNSIVDANGNVYLTGTFNSMNISFGTTTLTNTSAGESDIFIVKYDVFGNLLWALTIGGNLTDYGQGIFSDASGNIILTGSFRSNNIIFNSDTLTNSNFVSNFSDIFFAKLGNVIVDFEEKITDQQFIFPNPGSGIFTFKGSQEILSVEIYNLVGELLHVQNNAKEINLIYYPDGIYIAKINGTEVYRLVKNQ